MPKVARGFDGEPAPNNQHSATLEPGPGDLGGLDRSWWQAVGETGIWQIPVPETMGGRGLAWTQFGQSLFDLGLERPDLGLLLSLVAHAGMIRMVLLFGDADQQANLLPWLAGGSCVGATAITEPGGGSDVRALRTTALPTPEGYLLSGTKCHITNAPVADAVIVVASLDTPEVPRDHIGLFLFEREACRSPFDSPEDMIGHLGSPTGGFTLDALPVAKASLLGQRAFPLEQLYKALALDRSLYALCCSAVMEASLERALERAAGRRAFGKALIDHQYVQKHLTDILVAKEVARVVGFEALGKLDRDCPEVIQACSIAKLVGSDGLITATQACMRVHGHDGYLRGEVSQMAMDALGSWFAAGTNDIQRLSILKQHLYLRRNKHA